jgi:hypothetical protein
MSVVMLGASLRAKKIPLFPPFSKGDGFTEQSLPLFEKEGIGEIFYDGNRRRFTP